MANPNSTQGIVPEFTLGDRLRKAREIAGLEMRDLAERTGVHRQSIARYEQGAATPRRPVILIWAVETGVDYDWIMGTVSDEMSTHVDNSGRTTDLEIREDYAIPFRGNPRD